MNEKNFLCPKCQQYQLTITASCDIEPDAYNDEARLQIIICRNCNFKGLAIYQEATRGSFDETNFTHTGYIVDNNLFNKANNDIKNQQLKNIENYLKNNQEKFSMKLVDN